MSKAHQMIKEILKQRDDIQGIIGVIGVGIDPEYPLEMPLMLRFKEGTIEQAREEIKGKGYAPIFVAKCSHEGEGYCQTWVGAAHHTK